MKLPSGPKTLPLLQLIHWIIDPLGFMHSHAKRHGDTFAVKFPSLSPLIFISNPQAIQEIFTSKSKSFGTLPPLKFLNPILGDHSLLLLDGNRHRRQRHLLMPPFHGKRMQAYGQIIHEITKQVISQWRIGEPVSMRPFMLEISLQVILQTIFGIDKGKRYDKLKELICSTFHILNSPVGATFLLFPELQKHLGNWTPWGHFLDLTQQIDRILYAEIKERREQPNSDGEDVLSLLMSARDENDRPMTDVELRDELMTMFIGGHETTALALTWALYWIHALPEVLTNLLKEIEILNSGFDLNAIMRMPYLSAVCSETLRIYPIAMVALPRVIKYPTNILGYELEPGMMLLPCIYLTHHRKDLYPNPECFRPERFLERQFSVYEYLPFGGGNRRCLGMAFAQFEMKIVLSTILSHCQLTLANRQSVRPVRSAFTLAPSNVRLVSS